MIDDRELFERASLRFDPPQDALEQLLRRRDRKRRNQRIGAGVLAIILALVSFAVLTRAFRGAERPADESPSLMPTGMVITFTNDDPFGVGDLVALDPNTGEVRTIVAADALRGRLQPGEMRGYASNDRIGSAAGSADRRWIAYELVACGDGFSDEAGTGGLWVTNGVDEPRQLTKPCFEDPGSSPYAELWAWSPVGAKIVVVRGDALVLIDPATGERKDLGDTVGSVTSLAWSPDGTRIAYSTMRDSVYSVSVDGGDHSLLASSVGSGSIVWSPDGAHILITDLYLMNADGSDPRELVVDGNVWGMSWSPDGTRLAYTTFSGGRDERQMQIWIVPADGSAPTLLFESAPAPFESGGIPVWSPDGTQIAFEHPSEHPSEYPSGYPSTDGETVWLVVNADGTGGAREIDELRYLSWGGGSYWCGCFG